MHRRRLCDQESARPNNFSTKDVGWNDSTGKLKKASVFWHKVWEEAGCPTSGVLSALIRHEAITMFKKTFLQHSSLGLDKAEWLEDIRKGSCSLKSFLGVAGEGIDERESGKFEEGLNSKVKLSLYRTFGKIVEFKKYLRGVGDAGTRLLFKFRSGTHGLNEELRRHRGREGRKECLLCDAECESVSHVLWDCPAYVSIRSAFMLELRRELGDRFEHFQSLDSFEKSSYVLGSEVWEEYSSGLLGLIKDFVLSVWEERKVRLYGEHANVHQSHSQNDSGDLRGVAGGDGELGCLCGKAGTSHLCDGSAHSSGCVVNGSNAMAAV